MMVNNQIYNDKSFLTIKNKDFKFGKIEIYLKMM